MGELRERRSLLFLGIFFTTLALLMLEVNITRLFSVVMFYHFSFLAVTMALFGLSAGGVLVYVFADRIAAKSDRPPHLAVFGVLFSASIVGAFLIFKWFPFEAAMSVGSFVRLFLLCVEWTVPFLVAGISVALALRVYGKLVSRLYFADLAGAACGCVAIVVLMEKFGSPTAIPIIAAFAALGAACFAGFERRREWVGVAVVGICALLSLAAFAHRDDVLEILSKRDFALMKEGKSPELLFARWNALSRVDVFTWSSVPGWGVSETFKGELPTMLGVQIDAAAATPLIHFDGDFAKLEFLKYDITEVVHFLKDGPSVFVIGPGGGRDILSALLFGAKAVYAADINSLMVDVVGRHFARFAGHIYARPDVTVVVDDARSQIRRSSRRFDIIQSSMTDTWAATAAGAFSLSENNLYTREAFNEYWAKLADDGLLSFSRYVSSVPGETLRVLSLCLACLEDQGVSEPGRHVAVLACPPAGTTLLKKSAFTAAEIDLLKEVASTLKYEILYLPGQPGDPTFTRFVQSKDREAFYRDCLLDVSPPTDDRPFFFNLLKPFSVLRSLDALRGVVDHLYAQVVVVFLFIVYLVLGFLLILLPLRFGTGKLEGLSAGVVPRLFYFGAIGLGFMLVEISTMQKMTLFLGHPTYSLLVVLFSLLLFTGMGSLLTDFVSVRRLRFHASVSAILVIAIIGAFRAYSSEVFERFMAASLPYRFGVCAAMLLPLGLAMGRLFPLGIKSLSGGGEFLIPWAWALNGLTSVLGSILAIMIGMWVGFSSCLVLGMLSYAGALAAVAIARQKSRIVACSGS
ncbi:MAG: hypothetical protein JW759_09555 [Candidatus Coatesbacteria bacterium]|nr:hypothetical protein [Candidatus Coatesbacteria bacterium]